jgi:asparagine synthase (glutamine-hydrolysing)
MCGIAGFVGASDPAALRAMANRLAHRGPDGEGLLADGPDHVHLAHRRLAVLDIRGGFQPMRLADDSVSIVFNGEIYNFQELREDLQRTGARFATDHSDTEVLLHGWRQWGPSLFGKLNGMWALALHDRTRRQLILSRDRFGKKPLYYHAGEAFVFASELSALRLHPATPSRRSEIALRKYFGYGFIPAPYTLLENVHKLPAGHTLTLHLGNGDAFVERYWRYEPIPEARLGARSIADVSAELLSRLDAAVARRLVADVPVGAFLSGGIDSSTVSALAMRHVGAERLKTFSIAFSDDSFDESQHARAVAQHIGAAHQVETCSVADLRDHLDDILGRLDEPMADASLLPTFLLCRHARQQVTVALGGDGADELLAGYDPFRALRYARLYQRIVPHTLHRGIVAAISRLPVSHRYMSLDFKLKRTLRGVGDAPRMWLPLWMSPLSPKELQELFQEPVDPEEIYSEAVSAWERSSGADDVDRSICFYVDLYLQDDILTKVDRASMMNSLEVRAPFLDIDLVDFLRTLPSNLKLRGSSGKWLLKQATRDLLPHGIIYRRKQGFAVPTGRWFEHGLVPAIDGGSSFWRSRLAEHQRGKADHRLYLWSQLVLDTFSDNASIGASA